MKHDIRGITISIVQLKHNINVALTNNVVLKHDIVSSITNNVVLKHGITSPIVVGKILKHNILAAYQLLVQKRNLKLNDTSKSINLNSDEGNSTSEGNNP